ncbi:hypothetical protein QYE76_054647 [Lolium multiflorum]|uniref:Coatomer subunit beta n=1 Tax=Lolium multiflorum TaxID=4521 RepID=A0AAD8WN39_LOLMU|nr:hypothetical protein QYE76_054647 [Lolium multiflorum]
MKLAIMLLLNGTTLPPLLRTLTLYVLPRREPIFEKLFFLYLEIIDKRDAASGEVCPEIVLFVKYFRYNLEKRNEYVRAITLRLLCRFREPELLHPLLPCIIANLEHEQGFVRRHALSAVLAVYHLPRGHMPLPYADMCNLVLRAVAFDQDADVRRTAFVFLCDCAQDLAVSYLLDNAPHVAKWPDPLQMAALDLICNKVCRSLDHSGEGGYMKIIFSILSNCRTAAVQYKCAGTLLSLSSRPISVVQVAAKTYCKLLTSQSDNNVKLVILDRLNELCTSHRHVMVNFVMDVLHSLAIPNVDIRRKVLDLVLGLLAARNVQEVVLYLKKEVVKMRGIELEKAGEYHQMLVQAIHACAVEHPEVAGSVVHLLVDFLGESNGAIACDVVLFVREIMETNPMLRESMIQRLFSAFCQIQESFVCSRALWMLAEYSFSVYEVESAISTIKKSVGNLPFYTVSEERESTDTSKPAHPMMNSCTACSKRSTVLADDAYATHIFSTNAAISAPVAHGLLASKKYLRSLVVSGDFHLAAVVACTLTKLVLRLEEVQPSKVEVNKASTESLLIMVSFLQLGQSFCARHPVDQDWYNRIVICVKLLCNSSVHVKKVWLLSFRQSFAEMLAEKMKIKAPISHVQPDGLIDFYHLKRRALNQRELDDDYRDYLKSVTVDVTKGADHANRLNRLVQLTGFSDPVYAEAYVMVNQYYNAVVDATVMNRTNKALQNLCLEFVTEGKNVIITDRSENYTLAPQESKQIQVNIEITTANSAFILGHIVYETSDGNEHSEVLKVIFINILDYMSPATCTDIAFRNMWTESLFQYKLKVNTVLHDEREFLNHVIKSTNMTCLTPPWALDGDCGLIAANLYAKSVFGEDVLMNICVEKQADGELSGCISIKGNVEGMVLNLGGTLSQVIRPLL